ncbi:MAG: S-layer homology domain-containing protein [Lachnospiraceae bacterium]|nr:S-layer homology domain-containing protein [Lachnospiraceae bacterium]
MKKHTMKNPRLKGAIAKLLAAALIVITMTSFATPPPVAHAAKKYFADVSTDDSSIDAMKYCNERGVFGKKQGKNFHFHPDKEIRKGKFLQYMYNMYGDKIDFGIYKYDEGASKS